MTPNYNSSVKFTNVRFANNNKSSNKKLESKVTDTKKKFSVLFYAPCWFVAFW